MSLEDKWMIAQMNTQLYDAYCRLERTRKQKEYLLNLVQEHGIQLGTEYHDIESRDKVRRQEAQNGVTASESND